MGKVKKKIGLALQAGSRKSCLLTFSSLDLNNHLVSLLSRPLNYRSQLSSRVDDYEMQIEKTLGPKKWFTPIINLIHILGPFLFIRVNDFEKNKLPSEGMSSCCDSPCFLPSNLFQNVALTQAVNICSSRGKAEQSKNPQRVFSPPFSEEDNKHLQNARVGAKEGLLLHANARTHATYHRLVLGGLRGWHHLLVVERQQFVEEASLLSLEGRLLPVLHHHHGASAVLLTKGPGELLGDRGRW